jgi:Asp-tRNA(Asn)/Glu-tRNA(Gln) amidotransferase A subunit family amidase
VNSSSFSYLPATEALDLFRSGKLSPVELMHAVIEQAEATEPAVNAFADCYFEEAIWQAKKAEIKYHNTKNNPGSLEGLPVAVKDDTAIQGHRTTVGSLLLKDNVSDYTNPSIERLLQAGAIIHARTTCPEFCWPWVCDSRMYGVTRNPWNLDYTCGGSSGGSAAALAAGSTILATGTDSAGSIRQPAAMCGVVGYKPPYGRNPSSPLESFDAYNHVGPMTRTVGDCALMQNVMSGPHPLDHTSVEPKLRIPKRHDPVAGLKIAYTIDFGCYEVADDVRRETLSSLAALRSAGAETVEVETGWAAAAIESAGHYGDHIYADNFTRAVEEHPEQVCDYTAYFAQQNNKITAADFHASLTIAGETWWHHLGPLFNEFDALVCPTVATQEVPAAMRPWEELIVNGKSIGASDWVMTILFNMFSRCPVLAIPSGMTDGGMPAGIQIVGRPLDDSTVFQIASELETAVNGFNGPQNRPG